MKKLMLNVRLLTLVSALLFATGCPDSEIGKPLVVTETGFLMCVPSADVCGEALECVNAKGESNCTPVPDACEGVVSCACMPDTFCGEMTCVDGDNASTIYCVNSDVPDTDGDGIPDDVDCEPESEFIYQGAPELCDEQDNDCDGETDEGCGPPVPNDCNGKSCGDVCDDPLADCQASFCNADGQCVCTPEDLGCKLPDCTSNDDCDENQYCNGAGTCADDGSCGDVADCKAAGNDYDGILCEGPLVCSDNLCTVDCITGCTSNDDCDDKQYCNGDGACIDDGSCNQATDCNMTGNDYQGIECEGPLVCTDNLCTVDCFEGCVSNDDCDDGDPCTEDTCTPALGCVHTPIPNCGNEPPAYFEQPCESDADCLDPVTGTGGMCLETAGGDKQCTIFCIEDCPAGYSCKAVELANGADTAFVCVPDAAPECTEGVIQQCVTLCQSIGVEVCDASGTFGPCTPPAEVCNGKDDDCDGVTDEGCDTCTDNLDCAKSQYCHFFSGDCGAFTKEGSCADKPFCPDPGGVGACGCNGQSYVSVCEAKAGGTDVLKYGGCSVGNETTYRCGNQTCDPLTAYCEISINDVPGPEYFASCQAIPAGCAAGQPATCDCLDVAAFAWCTDAAQYSVVIIPGG